MILGFKTKFPNGELTHFVEKIYASVDCNYPDGIEYKKIYTPKLHSIRNGHQWFSGRYIHMATGVRTKNYHQFNKNVKGLQVCISVQSIEIEEMIITSSDHCYVFEEYSKKLDETFVKIFKVKVDGRSLETKEIYQLAANDGFNNTDDFFRWFNGNYVGKIIHWTNLKY